MGILLQEEQMLVQEMVDLWDNVVFDLEPYEIAQIWIYFVLD